MRTLLIALALVFSSTSFAGLDLGHYQGTDKSGTTCGFEVLSVQYKDGLKHPLNEEIEIQHNGKILTLRHPALIDLKTGDVGFNHDQLVASNGIPQGGFAIVLEMVDTPDYHGPRSMTVLIDNYQDKTKSQKIVCSNMSHQN